MTETERIEVLRQFLDSCALGIPLLWWTAGLLFISAIGMIWIVSRS